MARIQLGRMASQSRPRRGPAAVSHVWTAIELTLGVGAVGRRRPRRPPARATAGAESRGRGRLLPGAVGSQLAHRERGREARLAACAAGRRRRDLRRRRLSRLGAGVRLCCGSDHCRRGGGTCGEADGRAGDRGGQLHLSLGNRSRRRGACGSRVPRLAAPFTPADGGRRVTCGSRPWAWPSWCSGGTIRPTCSAGSAWARVRSSSSTPSPMCRG